MIGIVILVLVVIVLGIVGGVLLLSLLVCGGLAYLLVQKAGNGRTGNFFFDPTVFSAPAFSGNNPPAQPTYGNLGRNAFRGPARTNFDVSISKVTTPSE